MKLSVRRFVLAGLVSLCFTGAAHAQLSNNEKATLVDLLKRLGAKVERDPGCAKLLPSDFLPSGAQPSPIPQPGQFFWPLGAVTDDELSRGLEFAYCDLHPARCDKIGIELSLLNKVPRIKCR